MHFVYILFQPATGKWYIGYTGNLGKSLAAHEGLSLWRLVYYEYYVDKTDAIDRQMDLRTEHGWNDLLDRLKSYLEHLGEDAPKPFSALSHVP